MTIRNDATRLRLPTREQRRLRAVVPRQGQVLLDTDFDQHSNLQLERIEQETRDTLGSPGRLLVPAGSDGFKITNDASNNPIVGAGHGFLDGWLLDNAAACRMFTPPPAGSVTQPHPRESAALTPTTVVGIKALVRHLDPAEEPVLADVALGDAQASGRALSDWQVFPLALPGAPATCAAVGDDPTWKALVAPSTGTLQVIEKTAPPSTDPCTLTPGGGYSRLENLLYRLEVHDGVADNAFPTVDGPRFKLHDLKLKISRRNASVMVRITQIDNLTIQVEPPALDPRNWFAPGLYAEIVSIHDDVDPSPALLNERLFRVAQAKDDRVTLEAASPNLITNTKVAADGTWFLRLWDSFPATNSPGLGIVSAPNNANISDELDIGDGLAVKLGKLPTATSATFRRGDFWAFAARADGSIDWPKPGGNPEFMTPHGPEIRYAALRLFTPAGETPADDCRVPFGSLSDKLLLYRGGDGQSVYPDTSVAKIALPAKLRVAAMVGDSPLVGATVRWTSSLPAGQKSLINGQDCFLNTPVNVTTDPDGLAEVTWEIDRASMLDKYQVEAALVVAGAVTKPPIVFTAKFDVAERVGYSPPDNACAPYASVRNVDAALDQLIKFACNPPTGDGGLGCCHTVGEIEGQKAEFTTILEAIKTLREQGHKYICLCLLPGDYPLSGQEMEELTSLLDKEVIEFEMGGHGAFITVESPMRFFMQRRVRLHDLQISSKDPQALQFAAENAMDVTLTGLKVATGSVDAKTPLVEFLRCSQIRVSGCDIEAAPERPGLRDLIYVPLYELMRNEGGLQAAAMRTELGKLTDVDASTRKKVVGSFDHAVETHRAAMDDDEIVLLEAAIDPIRKGKVPGQAAMAKLINNWVSVAAKFDRRTWSTAVAFTALAESDVKLARTETDAVIDDCRIRGGIMVGTGSRDTSLEEQTEEVITSDVLPESVGRLRVDETAVRWISIGSDQLNEVKAANQLIGLSGFVFHETMVTRNTFASAPHLNVAANVAVHSNSFEAAADERVGLFAAEAVSGTGNIGPRMSDPQGQLLLRSDSGSTVESANARLIVQLL